MPVDQDIQLLAKLPVSDFTEEQLQQINPKVVAAIKAVQAERMGTETISWSDFSSHDKTSHPSN